MRPIRHYPNLRRRIFYVLRVSSVFTGLVMKTISKMTELILQQPGELTNRQVADKLNIDIDTVRHARRRHGVKHASTKRCRGAAQLVAAQYGRKDAGVAAAEIGCSRVYVNQIWRQIREGNN